MRNLFCVALLLVFFTGCGTGFKFGGTVKLDDGTPLTGGTVSFVGERSQYDGSIKPDGSYTLRGATANDGVPAGNYKVAVTGVSDDDGFSPVLEKYSSTETSGLSCEVKSGGRFDIVLEKAAKPETGPKK